MLEKVKETKDGTKRRLTDEIDDNACPEISQNNATTKQQVRAFGPFEVVSVWHISYQQISLGSLGAPLLFAVLMCYSLLVFLLFIYLFSPVTYKIFSIFFSSYFLFSLTSFTSYFTLTNGPFIPHQEQD